VDRAVRHVDKERLSNLPVSLQGGGPRTRATRRSTNSQTRCQAKRAAGRVCAWNAAKTAFRSRLWRSRNRIVRRCISGGLQHAMWPTVMTKATASQPKCSSTAGRDAACRSNPL